MRDDNEPTTSVGWRKCVIRKAKNRSWFILTFKGIPLTVCYQVTVHWRCREGLNILVLVQSQWNGWCLQVNCYTIYLAQHQGRFLKGCSCRDDTDAWSWTWRICVTLFSWECVLTDIQHSILVDIDEHIQGACQHQHHIMQSITGDICFCVSCVAPWWR